MKRQRISEFLSQHTTLPPLFAARELNVPERDILRHLDDGTITEVAGTWFDDIMSDAARWGVVTLIVTNNAAIVEVKSSIPAGTRARGFYNLHAPGNPLSGHLSPDRIASIFFVSRPLMGKESHSIQFFDHEGNCAFKIYVGRDDQGNIQYSQLSRFIELKQRCEQ